MRGVNAILVATAILLRVSIGNCQVSESLPPLNLGAGVQLSGLLDTYYSLNDNHPRNDVNTYHNFDGYNSSLRLNVAEMGFSRDPDPIGFEVDAGLGDLYTLVNASEPDSPLRNFLQMYASYKIKPAHDLQLDFGKFQTSAGIESAETLTGWNYSRSLLFVYAQPNYHFGLRSEASFGAHLKAGLQWVNGWNRVVDGNGFRTIAVTSELASKKWDLYQDYYYGAECVDGALRPRGLYDVTLLGNLLSSLKMDVNVDAGYQRTPSGTDTRHGVAGSLQWTPAARVAISPRYEWFHDVEGSTTGTAQILQEGTVTGQYTLYKGLVARAELRIDVRTKTYSRAVQR